MSYFRMFEMHGYNKNRAFTMHCFIEGLMEAMRTYDLQEGIILTESEQDTIKINELAISVIPIWKWLLFQ